jgi:hypothetical protein
LTPDRLVLRCVRRIFAEQEGALSRARTHFWIRSCDEPDRKKIVACNKKSPVHFWARMEASEVDCATCLAYMKKHGISEIPLDTPGRTFPVDSNPAHVRFHLAKLRRVFGSNVLRSLRRSKNTMLVVWRRTQPHNWFVTNTRRPGDYSWHSESGMPRPELKLFEEIPYEAPIINTYGFPCSDNGRPEETRYRLKECLRA